jgi:hypothetical protein
MTERILTLRELNRTTLARQMLLTRTAGTAPEAVARLVGLQAQAAMAPFVGLWSRLESVRREDIAGCLESRSIVKATSMRGTLHLLTAEDYLRFRSTLQPVLTGAFEAVQKGRAEDLNVPPLLEAAEKFLAESPRTFAEISKMATGLVPDTDIGVMRYAVRTHIPLVQVPVPKAWSFPGNPQFALAESWLGKKVPPGDHFEELILRYLAAFGPASVTDIQAWSGFGKLKERIEKMRPELTVYRDEHRRELFDHPAMNIEDPETPAPERFLPEFDNVLLSFSNRTRVVADEHRPKVYVPVLRVRATILVDGFVAGTWKTEKAKGTTTLKIEPFARLSKASRLALTEEGEGLVRFIGYDTKNHAVQFVA